MLQFELITFKHFQYKGGLMIQNIKTKILKKKDQISICGDSLRYQHVNLLQHNTSPQPHVPLMAEQWQAEDWWSIINQWVGVDVTDTAWGYKVALPRHLLLWSVASDIITYSAGAPTSLLGRELSKLDTTLTFHTHIYSIYTRTHTHIMSSFT